MQRCCVPWCCDTTGAMVLQDPGREPSQKRLRLAADSDVHSRAAEQHFMHPPDASNAEAATALCERAAAVCCSCALVPSPHLNPPQTCPCWHPPGDRDPPCSWGGEHETCTHCYTCLQVQAIPAQCGAVAELWLAWGHLSRPPVAASRDAHGLLTSSFVACCSATIAVVKMTLQVLPRFQPCRHITLNRPGLHGSPTLRAVSRDSCNPAISGYSIRDARTRWPPVSTSHQIPQNRPWMGRPSASQARAVVIAPLGVQRPPARLDTAVNSSNQSSLPPSTASSSSTGLCPPTAEPTSPSHLLHALISGPACRSNCRTPGACRACPRRVQQP